MRPIADESSDLSRLMGAGAGGSSGVSGIAQMATGIWYNLPDPADSGTPEYNGDLNALIPDHGISCLTQRPRSNSCLVRVRRFVGFASLSPAYRALDPASALRKTPIV